MEDRHDIWSIGHSRIQFSILFILSLLIQTGCALYFVDFSRLFPYRVFEVIQLIGINSVIIPFVILELFETGVYTMGWAKQLLKEREERKERELYAKIIAQLIEEKVEIPPHILDKYQYHSTKGE